MSLAWNVPSVLLLPLAFAAWLSVAFHAFALFRAGKAFMSLQAAKKATAIR